MDRGIRSANTVVNYVFLRVGPTIIECIVMVFIFIFTFNAPFAGIVALVSFAIYLIVTIYMTKWRKKIRARMNAQDNDAHDKAVDSLTNFETVKYFTNEDYELNRYRKSVALYQKHMFSTSVRSGSCGARLAVVSRPLCVTHVFFYLWRLCGVLCLSQWSLYLLNSSQQLIVRVAVALVLIFAALQVVDGDATVGDFVTMNVYIVQVRVFVRVCYTARCLLLVVVFIECTCCVPRR